VCGAAACAITCAVTDLGAGVGVSLGAVVAGATLIFQGQQQKPAEQREEKESKKESKKSKGKKLVKKQAAPSSPRAPASPEPAEKKKSEKSKKESAPKSPPQKSPAQKSPAQKSPPQQQNQQKAKSPQKTPSVESEQKEPTKTQLQKAKKKQKKEAEEKAKAEEKALEVKREQAQAKKAAKAAQKKKEKEVVSPQVQAQASDEEDVKEEEVLEDGWEKPKPRNTVRIRSPKEIKKAKDAAIARSKGPSSEEPKVVVEVRVPKHKHGSIIGPKGSFLTLIQDKTGATINMPKREGGGLGVVISGSAQQVKEAEQAVRDIRDRGYSTITHPGLESNELLLEDEKQIGRIAGKGGVYLKAIQDKSGASLQLPDRKSAQPGNKIIILGKQSEITNAKLALMELVRQGYCEYTHPGWITEEFDFNSDYLGRLIGPKGTKIQELSSQFDVKIDTPKRDPNNKDADQGSKQDIIVIKGTQSNIDRAKEAISELLSQSEVTEEIPAPDPNDPWQQDPVEPEW
jgi:rRNA processing protein Krr1/Pno1